MATTTEPTYVEGGEYALAHSPTTTAPIRRDAMTEIRELAAGLAELRAVCEALCKATILPPLMQHPANLQLVIMQGLSMGFTVWQAIRASFIIPPKKDGEVPRVGYYVDSLIALVRRSDKCRFFRIEKTTAEEHVVMCARTDEGTEQTPFIHIFELTRQQAHEAGMDVARYWDKEARRMKEDIKFNWQQNPADMLNARNCGRAVKRVFQDVVFGMATPDELEDIAIADRGEEGEVFASIPRAAMTARRVDASGLVHTVDAPFAAHAGSPLPPDPVAAPSTAAPSDGGSGDPAWDDLMRIISKLAGIDTSGWLPDDMVAYWKDRLAAVPNKAQLTLLAPWIGNVGARMSESKACSDVFAEMRRAFNERDAEIKKAERAAKASEPAK